MIKNKYYILQFIDSARVMESSLSNLANNFSERIHIIKCKHGHDDKNVRLKYQYCLCLENLLMI